MTSTMPLVLILLAVLTANLYYIIKAEGGFGEFPRLMERVGISLDEIPLLNIFFFGTEDVRKEKVLNDQ